jgi:hypothetical protein
LHIFIFITQKTQANKALQHRSASLHWTAFKSRFCGFAAQKYSTTRNLKAAAELNVRLSKPNKLLINWL